MTVSRWLGGLAAFFIVFIYLYKLGGYPLVENSEARYTEVAWEMLQKGDYLQPTYNGIKHFHKPPLFYWAIALSMKFMGQNEFAARLPCALAALFTLALTFYLSHQMLKKDENTSWLAVVILATSPFFWEMGRVAVTDMLVCLFTLASLLASWYLLHHKFSYSWWLVFWVALGLNFLTKGPVGLLLVASVLLPYCLRQKLSLRLFRVWPGLAAAGLISMPWYLWAIAHNVGLARYFLVFQTVDRVFTNVHHRNGPIWFYLPVILAGFLPWTLNWLSALGGACRRVRLAKKTEPSPDLFLLLWAFLPLVFFSLIKSKLPPYVLPCFPALAIAAASAISGAIRSGNKRLELCFPSVTLLLVGACCWANGKVYSSQLLQAFVNEIALSSYWLLVLGMLSLFLAALGQIRALVAGLFITMSGILLLAGSSAYKVEHLSAKPVALAIQNVAKGPFEVAMLQGYFFGLPFYLRQPIVHVGYPREVQFETELSYKERYFKSLKEYLPIFIGQDKERFLILGRNIALTVPVLKVGHVIYRDSRITIIRNLAP